MRVFLSSENPVEFVPNNQKDVLSAEQATKYAHWKFQQLDGYRLLNDAIHDALIKKTGVLKIWWESNTEATMHTYTNVTDEEMMAIVMNLVGLVLSIAKELEIWMVKDVME